MTTEWNKWVREWCTKRGSDSDTDTDQRSWGEGTTQAENMLAGGAWTGDVSIVTSALRAGASALDACESRVDRCPTTPLCRAVVGGHLATTAVLLLQCECELANLNPEERAENQFVKGKSLLPGWELGDPNSKIYMLYIDDHGESADEDFVPVEHETGDLLRAMLTFPWAATDTALRVIFLKLREAGGVGGATSSELAWNILQYAGLTPNAIETTTLTSPVVKAARKELSLPRRCRFVRECFEFPDFEVHGVEVHGPNRL